MSISFEAKNRKSPFGQFNIASRRGIGSRSCFCKVVFFHYTNQNLGSSSTKGRERGGSSSNLMTVVQGVLETEIASVRVTKSLDTTSSFELRILPTKNWKQFISPGDWFMIYMFDGAQTPASSTQAIDTKNLIMLGNVDRISRSLEKDKETDKSTLRFVVAGRGIGKVFENTDIWFNPYLQKEQTIDVLLRDAGIELTGNPTTMINLLLDIFLGAGGQLSNAKTSDLKAWQIPAAMAKAVGAATVSSPPKFYDILKKEIEPDLPGYKARQMLTLQSNGSLMELLRRSANELVNELYFEEIRDNSGKVYPTIVLKPRPINTPQFEAAQPPKLNGKVKSLQTLARENFVEILQSEIIYEDMGKDDHTKFNLWWLDADNRLEGVMTAQENKGGASNPLFISDSIRRDGLRRYQQMMDFSFIANVKSSGQNDTDLFAATLDQLFDMHHVNHLYESGTIECTGVLEAEVGKALIVKADPTIPGGVAKVFLIEGYEHKWEFPSTWRTIFTLTHGQWLRPTNYFIDVDPASGGAPDDTLSTNYLAQTKTSRT